MTASIVRRLRRARGIGLVTAIFVLVVLAGLSVAMVSFTTAQQATVAMDVLGERGVQSARAGIEWALYESLPQGDNKGTTMCGQSFKMPSTSTLSTFTVTVSCPASQSYTLGGATVTRTRLLSVACNQPTAAGSCPNGAPGADYVERQMEAEF